MSVYKVAQDVEADDKLIGPFSFRQFIYLIVVVIAIGLGWGLAQVFIPLAVLVLPVVVFFGALALPLKKDQPMETYLAAVVAFHLKPKFRIWVPDGIESLVEITAPKVVEKKRTKDLSELEAQRRLSYLADIVDTEGWAVRGTAALDADTAMVSDVFYEAQQTVDILDDNGGIAQALDTKLTQANSKRRQELTSSIQNNTHQNQPYIAPPPVDPYSAMHQQQITTVPEITLEQLSQDPYSTSHQASIKPVQQPQQPAQYYQPTPQPTPQAQSEYTQNSPNAIYNQQDSYSQPQVTTDSASQNPQNTSEIRVSPDIINLASNSSNLSVETIAHEAKRMNEKSSKLEDEGEVVIKLH